MGFPPNHTWNVPLGSVTNRFTLMCMAAISNYGLDPALIEINGRVLLSCSSAKSEPAGCSENTKDLMALVLDAFASIWGISVVSWISSIRYSCLVHPHFGACTGNYWEFLFVGYPITEFLILLLLVWEICCLSWYLFPPCKLSNTFARWVIKAGSSTCKKHDLLQGIAFLVQS